MSAHTPTPWESGKSADNPAIATVGYVEDVVFGVPTPGYPGGNYRAGPDYGSAEDDAAFIVRAVNAHDALVAALKGVIRVADRDTDEFNAARAALANVEVSS